MPTQTNIETIRKKKSTNNPENKLSNETYPHRLNTQKPPNHDHLSATTTKSSNTGNDVLLSKGFLQYLFIKIKIKNFKKKNPRILFLHIHKNQTTMLILNHDWKKDREKETHLSAGVMMWRGDNSSRRRRSGWRFGVGGSIIGDDSSTSSSSSSGNRDQQL